MNLSNISALPSTPCSFLYKRIREAVMADLLRFTKFAISVTESEILMA